MHRILRLRPFGTPLRMLKRSRRIGAADDPQDAVLLDVQPAAGRVGRFDARPRLGQRDLGVAHPLRNGNGIAAFVAVQRGRAEQAVLRQAAHEHITVGQIQTAVVDVGLQHQPLAGLEAVAPRLAHLNHSHRHLVALHHRVAREIAIVEPRMARTLADDLDIGVAQPDRIGTNEDLIGRGARGGPARGPAVDAEVLDACTEKRPGEHRVRNLTEGHSSSSRPRDDNLNPRFSQLQMDGGGDLRVETGQLPFTKPFTVPRFRGIAEPSNRLDNRLDDRDRRIKKADCAMPTIKDVAQQAGVSPTTVSYVLTGSRFVRPATRARIVRAIEELNYQPNHVARSLRAKRTLTVGMIVSDISNPFYADIVRGVEDVLSDRHYSLILCNTDEAPERERVTLQLLVGKKIDGLIIVTTGANVEALAAASQSGLPIVLVDRRLPGDWLDTVLVDDRQGAEMAVRHLLGLGHRRIGAIIGRAGISTTDSRRLGYEVALTDFGVAVDPDLIRNGQSTVDGGGAAALALLDLRPRPTAVFAANNLMTLGLFRTIKEYGLRCPEDVAVVGFDDMVWLAAFAPGVTTIAQPNYDLGKRSAELLMDRLTGTPPESPRIEVLPARLVVRESSGGQITRHAA